jgi:L-arabinonolactonase
MPHRSPLTAEPAFDARTELGECILWCERTRWLYWTDIEGRSLHRWRPGTADAQQWRMPEPLGSFALCETPQQLLLGLASGVALFDLDTGTLGAIVPVEADQPTTRINDGRCDRQGRFVFGTFNQARGGDAIGHFYRVSGNLEIERLPLPPARVANGIAFSPDGSRIYFADSPTREIRCAAYGADGTVGPWQTLITFAEGDGYPDGATVDADGGLWSTHWDGGCITRHAPDGTETHRIALPVTRPTCPAFAGAGLEDLYITTARIGLKPDKLAAQPGAGGILRVRSAGQGLGEARFRPS